MASTITALESDTDWRIIGETAGRHRGDLVQLLLWSILEAMPTLFSGVLIAGALDLGFMKGDFTVGAQLLGIYAVVIMIAGSGRARPCSRSPASPRTCATTWSTASYAPRCCGASHPASVSTAAPSRPRPSTPKCCGSCSRRSSPC